MTETDHTSSFTKSFLISFLAHLGLLLLAASVGKVVGTIWKTNDIEIIRSSIRVDVVGMPKFTIQELKEMEKNAVDLPKESESLKSPEKVEAKPEETPDVIKKDDLVIQEASKDKEKMKASFLNKLTDYAKVNVKKETKKGKVDGKGNENIKALVLEGNRLSQGTALTGDYSDTATSEYGAYVQTLPGVVRPYFKLPSYLMDQNLVCKVKIYLSGEGSLIKTEIVQSSGNAEYDARAEKAARDANYPKPTEIVAPQVAKFGIILRFPL